MCGCSDDVFLTIHGEGHYLWRAADQKGHVLDMLPQRRGDMKAAKEICSNLLKGYQDVLRVRTNDTLKSNHAAKREILARVEHRQHCHRNNTRTLGILRMVLPPWVFENTIAAR